MDVPNTIIIFILLLGAAILGFIAAWLIRQKLVDKLTHLVLEVEKEKKDTASLADNFGADRTLLQEEVEKYKESYNVQLMKSQRLAENIRQNQAEMESLQLKLKSLTEISLQAQQEISELKFQLQQARSIHAIPIDSTSRIAKGSLSLLDKSIR